MNTDGTSRTPKAEALLDWIYRLQPEEGDPDLKVLVFTEFVPPQEMLHEFLTERGLPVACLNGAMDMKERKPVCSMTAVFESSLPRTTATSRC